MVNPELNAGIEAKAPVVLGADYRVLPSGRQEAGAPAFRLEICARARSRPRKSIKFFRDLKRRNGALLQVSVALPFALSLTSHRQLMDHYLIELI